MAQGNRYTFRVRPSTYMQTKMLVEAVKGKAVKTAGRSSRRTTSTASRPRPTSRADQGGDTRRPRSSSSSTRRSARSTPAPPSTRSRQAKPDGIFNVLFGADLTPFVREGNTRGLFERRTVASLLTGEPEYLLPARRGDAGGLDRHRLPVGADRRRPRTRPSSTPTGRKFNDTPRLGSFLGYVVGYMMRDLHRQGRLHRHREADRRRFEDMHVRHRRRPGDDARASTTSRRIGAWVGETTLQGQAGRHEELALRGRRQVTVPGGRGEGGAQGIVSSRP